jgi:hypothetical protein
MSVRQDVKEDVLRANLINSDHIVKWIISNFLKIFNRFKWNYFSDLRCDAWSLKQIMQRAANCVLRNNAGKEGKIQQHDQ